MSTVSAATVIRLATPPTLRVLPLLVRPSPAVTSDEPENCENVIEVEPTVIGFSVMIDQPVFAFAVPSSTKV